MYGKKGYIRTVEAVVAIVIILMFIFAVTPRYIPETRKVPIIVETAQEHIRVELMTNEELRNEIITSGNGQVTNLDILIESTLPTQVFGYTYEICASTTCISTELTNIQTSVYTTDVFLVIDNGDVKPLVVRIWIWQKIN